MIARMENPRIPASANVRALNIESPEESSGELESEEVEPVEEGGMEVPGVTVDVKNPMSEVVVSAAVLLKEEGC